MTSVELNAEEEKAWQLYCKAAEISSMSARDFWHELPNSLQQVYLSKVRHARLDEIRENH